MQMLYVTYPGGPETHFDRGYYMETHLPLVLESWRKYGLQTIAAFFPDGTGEGTIAICACAFRDEEAVRASFSSPEAHAVMADVPRFTEAKPNQNLTVPLQ